jgi:hypothetical protein
VKAMPPTENRAAGTGERGLDHVGSNNSANVIPFPSKIQPSRSPFDQLTAELILAQYRAGTLPEAILVALLAGVGLVVPR